MNISNTVQNNLTNNTQIILPLFCDIKINKLISNNIRYTIVNNSNFKQSGCLIIVNAGYYNESISGLAHLLEHVIMNYNSNSYKFYELIDHYNGSYNATTDSIQTSYYFTIAPQKFNETFVEFSKMFTNPWFVNHPEIVYDEINIVHSEFIKDSSINFFKHYQLVKDNSIDPHFRMLGCGNKTTLNNSLLIPKLIKFYKRNYISTNISIYLFNYQKTSINIFTHFDNYNNLNFKKPLLISPKVIVNPIEKNKIIKIHNKNNYHSISIYYSLEKYLPIQIINYIFYILNKVTSNSLYSILRTNNLINSFNISIIDVIDDFYIANIQIELVEYGFGHMEVILSIINTFIKAIIDRQLNIMHYTYYLNLTKINKLYDNKNISTNKISNYIRRIINNHKFYDLKLQSKYDNTLFLNNSYISETEIIKYNKIYNLILNNLLLSNSFIVYDSYRNQLYDPKIEKYYNIEYMIQNNIYINEHIDYTYYNIFYITNSFEKTFTSKNINHKTYLNNLMNNKYITNNFKNNLSKDVLINKIGENNLIVFFSHTNSLNPKTNIIISFDFDEIFNNPNDYIISQILFNVVMEKINIIFDELYLAGLLLNIDYHRHTLIIHVEFFNDNIFKVIQNILNIFFNNIIDYLTFDYAKYRYRLKLETIKQLPLHQNLDLIIEHILFKDCYLISNQLENIENVTRTYVDKIRSANYIFDLAKVIDIKGIIYGNDMNLARDILLLIQQYNKRNHKEQNFKMFKPITKEKEHIIKIDDENNILFDFMLIDSDVHINNFIEHKMCHYIIKQLIKPSFFNIFRSQKQYGYIVKITNRHYDETHRKIQGIKTNDMFNLNSIFVVNFYLLMERNKKNLIEQIKKEINNFLKDKLEIIKNISEEKISKFKQYFLKKISFKNDSFYNQTKQLYKYLTEGYYNIDFTNNVNNAYNKINKETIYQFYNKYYAANDDKIIIRNYISMI